jgi:hypothetical protein
MYETAYNGSPIAGFIRCAFHYSFTDDPAQLNFSLAVKPTAMIIHGDLYRQHYVYLYIYIRPLCLAVN